MDKENLIKMAAATALTLGTLQSTTGLSAERIVALREKHGADLKIRSRNEAINRIIAQAGTESREFSIADYDRDFDRQSYDRSND